MVHSTWLLGAASALAFGLMAASVQASPASSVAAGFKATVGEGAAAENAHWGRRRHRYYYSYEIPYPYLGGYFGPRRYYYYGYAPGLRFYWGPRRHHRHWHRRRW